jgi:hypothetical protein
MRAVKIFVMAGALVCGAALLRAPEVSAQSIRFRVRDKQPNVLDETTVQHAANGFVIGILFQGEAFDAQCRTTQWVKGDAHGNVMHQGWVEIDDLLKESSERREVPRCSASQLDGPALHTFMRALRNDPYRRTVEKNSITCPDGRQSRCDGSATGFNGPTTLYRNRRRGTISPSHALGLTGKESVKWRYVTTDGKYVMVHVVIAGRNYWGFVPRGSLPPTLPVDADCRQRESCGT